MSAGVAPLEMLKQMLGYPGYLYTVKDQYLSLITGILEVISSCGIEYIYL